MPPTNVSLKSAIQNIRATVQNLENNETLLIYVSKYATIQSVFSANLYHKDFAILLSKQTHYNTVFRGNLYHKEFTISSITLSLKRIWQNEVK